MTKRRRILFVLISCVMIASLAALGIWQLKRMQWKDQLIAQISTTLTAKPVSINDITAGIEYGYDVDWLRIKLTGTYLHNLERYVYAPGKAGIGYQVITPFIEKSGSLVFVDRGWVSEAQKNQKTRQPKRQPEGTINLIGVTRVHQANMTLFQADADLASKTWYWYDLETMAADLPAGVGQTPDGQLPVISPVFMQIEPGGEAGTGDWPKIPPVKLELPNNHFQYAITWLSLAVIVFGMMIVFLKKQKPQEAPD